MRVRHRLGSCAATTAVSAAIVVLCVQHADDVADALVAVAPSAIAAAVLLHIATLAVRTEAWRVTIAAVGGDALPRTAVHGANAVAFVAGAVQSQAALPTRVMMLRRLAGDAAPRPAQIWVADVPIFALELLATAVLLVAATLGGRSPWWVAVAAIVVALCVLLGARAAPRRFAGRPMLRGLAVLADPRRRGRLAALVAGVVTLTIARLWLVLTVCDLPHGPGDVAIVFAAMGVFGLLPVGPGAPVAATLAALGAAELGAVVAAGLMLLASSLVAVFVYAGIAGLTAARLPSRG